MTQEKLKNENDMLRSMCHRAAVEIEEHWEAHCDEDGYGPINLLDRLKEIRPPTAYGHPALDAGFAQMKNALERIVTDFDELNGAECSGHCGKCIRCIALKALPTAGICSTDFREQAKELVAGQMELIEEILIQATIGILEGVRDHKEKGMQ